MSLIAFCLILVHGCRKFVELTDLEDHNFMDRDGEFQLEFMLSSIQSIFEHKFRIKMFHNSMKMGKLETGYFAFGLYDWSLSIYPTGRADSQLGKTRIPISYLVVLCIYFSYFWFNLKYTNTYFQGPSVGDGGFPPPGLGGSNQATSMTIYLTRQNHLDRTCR